jgi:APA family basic amino acid/polyamine antiporter
VSAAAADGARAVRPALGFWAATALVVGNMIGSGLFLLPASLANVGGAAFLGWGISSVGALLLALVFARLGLAFPRRGGPYAFAREAFGDATGFAVAWSYWVSNWCGNAAIAVACAGYADALLPGAPVPGRGAALALAALWLTTLVNLRGVGSAGRMQVVLTLLKLLPLAAMVLVGAWSVSAEAWHPFNRGGGNLFGVATSTAALTLWAFLGLECATIPAGDVRDARRVIPRATVVGTLIGIVFTVCATMTVVGLLPQAQLAASTAPFADAAARLWGGTAAALFGVAAALACLGALNGWVLMQGQMPLALAEDGLFPRVFARRDARGTPWFAIIASTVLSSALVVANYQRDLVGLFTFAILLSTAATLLAYLVGSAAALRLRERVGRNALSLVVAAGALVFSVWALVGTGTEALLWGAVLVLAGAPVYLWQRRRGGVSAPSA